MSGAERTAGLSKPGLAVPGGAAGPALSAPSGYPTVQGPGDDPCGCGGDVARPLAVPPPPVSAPPRQPTAQGIDAVPTAQERQARIHALELRMTDGIAAFGAAVSDCKATLTEILPTNSGAAAIADLVLDVGACLLPSASMGAKVARVLINQELSAVKKRLRSQIEGRVRTEVDHFLTELADAYATYIRGLRESLRGPKTSDDSISFLAELFQDDRISRKAFKSRLDDILDHYKRLVLPIGARRRAHDPRLLATLEFVKLLVCIKGTGLALVEYADLHPASGYVLQGYVPEILKCAALAKHQHVIGTVPKHIGHGTHRGVATQTMSWLHRLDSSVSLPSIVETFKRARAGRAYAVRMNRSTKLHGIAALGSLRGDPSDGPILGPPCAVGEAVPASSHRVDSRAQSFRRPTHHERFLARAAAICCGAHVG